MAASLMGRMMETVAKSDRSSNYSYKETTTTNEEILNKFTLDLNINLHVYHHNASEESTTEKITI